MSSTLPSTLAAFAAALAVLIVVHELGHYFVARLCNVKVLRFSVGFGRPLWTWRSGPDRTEWALAVFPFGGYVKMLDEGEGEVPAAELHRAFNRQSLGGARLSSQPDLPPTLCWPSSCTGCCSCTALRSCVR